MNNPAADARTHGEADPTAPAATSRERVRTGGRSEEVRRAVGDACLAFLAEGRIAFTTVELAERAGVSRKTIYRWWPTHDDVLVEGLSRHVRSVAVPDTGSWHSDVHEFAHRIATYAADPVEVATAAVMASRRHPDFGRIVLEQYGPVQAAWRGMVERAVARGDANAEHTSEAIVNALVAPLFLAPLMMGRKASDEEIDRTVAIVLAATRVDVSGGAGGDHA
ncbi:TetR/AcrR family transcriptional regulator C-terminal ligand-binding domain-containing protein [Rhodococcus sp. HNM0569]|uniref:TetR-like C-terminal domain-containing protein n=1 Tax=Rhodococcus sp. HNM0569 TaxID=2716340 RepID=UPI003211ED07